MKDPRISEIFYYFEQHTTISSGRTVGRKIGTVQEILVRKLLQTDRRVLRSVVYEPRVQGKSRATHKVEFVFFQPLEARVLGEKQSARFDALTDLAVKIEKAPASVHASRCKLTIRLGSEECKANVPVDTAYHFSDRLPLALTASFVRDGVAEVSLLDMSAPVASIESKRVGAQRFADSDKLGSGIQTIEKAKQASLVAIDFDLRFNDGLMCQTGNGPRKFKSIVALGNGVHWTDHDLAILETFVDNTYLVRDSVIIRYAEYVRAKAESEGKEFFSYFMGYFNGMTKTPPDDFVVTEDDFEPMRPVSADSLLRVVGNQIQPYNVHE